MLLSKSIDPDAIHEDSLDAAQMPPPNFLTPKSPVREKEDDEAILDHKREGSRTPRGMTPSKSEGNVAKMTKEHIESSPSRHNGSQRESLGQGYVSTPHIAPESTRKTSTPKHGPPPYNHDRYGERQRMGSSSGSDGSHSQTSTVARDSWPQYSQYQRNGPEGRFSPPPYSKQLNSSYHSASFKDQRSHNTRSDHLSASFSGRSEQYLNGNTGCRQNSDSSMNADPIYSTIPRKMNNGNNSLPSRNQPTAGNTNSLPRHNGNYNNSGYSTQQGTMPKSASSDQLGESPKRSRKYPAPMAPTEQFQDGRGQNSDSGMASQYTPGNVRNLVQNFQKSVQQNRPQTPSPGQQTPSQHGQQPREPPVPPPRRHRPLSAGPNRPNLNISVNINNTPRAQSVTPDYVPTDGVRPGSGRQLPARPDERKGQVPRPGSTPPRPTSGNPEDKTNPNSVWYEYGCV